MAVTNLIAPASYTPVYNPQWFKSSSNQTAQPNFVYTVVFTDIISGGTVTRNIDPDPAGLCQFDAGSFAEQYMTQLNPSNTYGFNVNTGAVRKIRVNIGETYGSTPAYTAGANQDYIVWNGSIDVLDFQSYAYTNYLYDRATSNIKYLTNTGRSGFSYGNPSSNYMEDDKTISSRSSYIYALCAAAGTYNQFEQIEIRGYNSAGSLLSTTVIANPNASSTNYINQYNFIDVGYKGLANMPVGQVASGTYPIPVSTFSYYDVYDTSTGVGAGAQSVFIKRYYVTCEPRFSVISIHFLAPKGEFESQLTCKLSIRNHSINKSFYSKLPYSNSGSGPVTYTYGASFENVLTSSIQSKITVNTDWLEEYEAIKLRDAFSSPIVYADLGDSGGFVSMKIANNSYQEQRRYNSQLISVSFDLEYTHTNIRQRG